MKLSRLLAATTGVAVTALTLSACAIAPADDRARLVYWMWDSSQMPGYQKCVDAFEKANSDVDVSLEQVGWSDYWTKLTTGLVADTAPDVFVNHTQQFGKYASLDQLLDLEPMVERDGIDLGEYVPGLTELWQGPSGDGLYGLPKDWDTIGLFYNADQLAEAGVDPDALWELDWNPDDGGSYEALIAHLTVDENGVRGDEEGFDKNNVEVYGLGLNDNNNGGYGQTQWSFLALANGWSYADQNPWGTAFNYDSPQLIETLDWWRSLIEKGYMPTFAAASAGMNDTDAFAAGRYAMITQGSWNARAIVEAQSGFEVGIAPTPIGPSGERASVMNGLADSIWAGTQHPEEAQRLVAYLASADCQDTIAGEARVFPALAEASAQAVTAFEEAGVQARAFSIHQEEGTGVTSPVVMNWTRLQEIMSPTMDAFLSFSAEDGDFEEANELVDALYE